MNNKLAIDVSFDRDKFLLRQKHFAISEKYYVWDEQGQPIIYIERPAHMLRNMSALFAGLISGVIFLVALITLGAQMFPPPSAVGGFCGLIGVFGGIALAIFMAIWLMAKRHITFYRDDRKQERLLEVLQDHKAWILTATYTVRDAAGQTVALLKKNYIYNIFRKRWHCFKPDGTLLCVAMEDSLFLSLLRRLLGPFFGVLRTNFVIFGTNGEKLGEFNRKFTLLDRYVLDMSPDLGRAVDRRVALALGVMLDTGERR